MLEPTHINNRRGFRDLEVWQKSYLLAVEIYKDTVAFPKNETFGLLSQTRRSAVSVMANIAEGYERKSRKEYLYFLNVAKGSLGEIEAYLLFSKDLGYIDTKKYEELELARKQTIKLLIGLIRHLYG